MSWTGAARSAPIRSGPRAPRLSMRLRGIQANRVPRISFLVEIAGAGLTRSDIDRDAWASPSLEPHHEQEGHQERRQQSCEDHEPLLESQALPGRLDPPARLA